MEILYQKGMEEQRIIIIGLKFVDTWQSKINQLLNR